MITLKTLDEIEILDKANKITNQVLDEIQNNIEPGIATQKLNDIAEKMTLGLGAIPAFFGYRGFPKALCISINSEIVHGIPGDRIIKNGDIIKIDFGVKYKGYFGDAARTIIVGQTSDNIKKLIENTRLALLAGIKMMTTGNRLYDVCGAIENMAKTNKYGNLRQYGGHGIGTVLHEKPFVPNYIDHNLPNVRLQDGIVLAIEPMFVLSGENDVKILDDGWTVVSIDNSITAHWEHSIAIVDGKPFILGQ